MQSTQRASRSTKTRPQNAKDLITVLENGNTLDARTKTASAILEAREVISNDPEAASRCLIVDSLSAWGVAQAAVLAELSRCRGVVVDGTLHPLLEGLATANRHILKNSKALIEIDQHMNADKSRQTGPLDVTNLFDGLG